MGTAPRLSEGQSTVTVYILYLEMNLSDFFVSYVRFTFQEYQIIKKSARSLSTVQVESPWRLAQPSIISIIVLMKGQGKVSALIWHVYINKAQTYVYDICVLFVYPDMIY